MAWIDKSCKHTVRTNTTTPNNTAQHEKITKTRNTQHTTHKQAHDTHITVCHFRLEEKLEKEETENSKLKRVEGAKTVLFFLRTECLWN